MQTKAKRWETNHKALVPFGGFPTQIFASRFPIHPVPKTHKKPKKIDINKQTCRGHHFDPAPEETSQGPFVDETQCRRLCDTRGDAKSETFIITLSPKVVRTTTLSMKMQPGTKSLIFGAPM